MLYLIKCSDYYKAGYAKNVKKRISQYRVDNPLIELIGSREGEKDLERAFHDYYKDFLLKRSEWMIGLDDESL